MKDISEYTICSDEILSAYQAVKNKINSENTILCQYIGTFTQDILISTVSLIEHTLIQDGASKTLQKRLMYLVIECIQNIIFHSDKLPNANQLAYIFITKHKKEYIINSSNTLMNKHVTSLENRINNFLDVKKEKLDTIFTDKIKSPTINKNGHGGIGLLTIISKSKKEFEYKIITVSKNYSIFQVEINVDSKNLR